MRASELLALEVYDRDGVCLGPVRDLRIAWSEERGVQPAVSSRFEVAGLVVGTGRFASAAHAWGFAEGRAAGPWPLRKLLAEAVAAARFVPADSVVRWGPGRIELDCAERDLRPLEKEIDSR